MSELTRSHVVERGWLRADLQEPGSLVPILVLSPRQLLLLVPQLNFVFFLLGVGPRAMLSFSRPCMGVSCPSPASAVSTVSPSQPQILLSWGQPG